MNTSAKLAKIRNDRGYTQTEFASILGLKQGTYSNYENGREMKASMIIKVCTILKCSPSWLLGVSEEGELLEEDSELMKELREAFDKLNEDGQQNVLSYADDLTGNAKYKKGKTNPQDGAPRVKTA